MTIKFESYLERYANPEDKINHIQTYMEENRRGKKGFANLKKSLGPYQDSKSLDEEYKTKIKNVVSLVDQINDDIDSIFTSCKTTQTYKQPVFVLNPLAKAQNMPIVNGYLGESLVNVPKLEEKIEHGIEQIIDMLVTQTIDVSKGTTDAKEIKKKITENMEYAKKGIGVSEKSNLKGFKELNPIYNTMETRLEIAEMLYNCIIDKDDGVYLTTKTHIQKMDSAVELLTDTFLRVIKGKMKNAIDSI